MRKGHFSQRQPWDHNPGRRTPSGNTGDPAVRAGPSPRHWRWAFGALPHPRPRRRVPTAERDSDPPPGLRSRQVAGPALRPRVPAVLTAAGPLGAGLPVCSLQIPPLI